MIDTRIIEKEIRYRTSRSSGSGGQHVNKVETRVEAIFNIQSSKCVSEDQLKTILSNMGKRINVSGELVVSSDSTKSQAQNKSIATKRLIFLIRSAAKKIKKRKNTTIPKSAHRKRLDQKRAMAEKKTRRSHNPFND